MRIALWAVLLSSACRAGTGGAPGTDGSTSADATSVSSTSTSGPASSDGTDADADADSSSTTIGSTGGEDSTSGGDPPGLRYHEVRQKSVHNAYQRAESFFDITAYHRARSLEIDLHTGKTLEPDLDGNWYVYHTDVTDDATSCRTLVDCLASLGAFTAAVPEHEVVTLWIDLKDPFDDAHAPADLDARLLESLGDALWSPDDLVAACPGARSLQDAVLAPGCAWPELAAMRGRVVAVLTGGNANLGDYTGVDPLARAAFAAPPYSDPAAIDGTDAVFLNAAAADVAVVPAVVRAGLVARVWDVNDEAAWGAAVDARAHHIATDMVNFHQDPWARIHADDGWPFECLGDCRERGPEPGRILGIDVESGDAWGSADSMWLLSTDVGAAPDGQWTAWIATPSSWVEPFAKGCLVARASLSADAASFAVCRTADEEPLRVQIRPDTGATTTAIEADVVDSGSIAPEGVPFVRLTVESDGTCARGEGSLDAATWLVIGEACFADPLVVQGVSASAHDAGPVRFLFGELAKDGAAYDLASLTTSVAVGTASATPFPGVSPQ